MGKQGFPKSPRPESLNFDGLKEYQLGWSEMLQNGDPSLGRRVSVGDYNWDKAMLVKGCKNDNVKFNACKGVCASKRHLWWFHRHMRSIIFTVILMGFFSLLDWFMFSYFDPTFLKNSPIPRITNAPQVRL